VKIVGGGVKFFWLDGTSYTDGPREINIYPGHEDTFYSNDKGCCVAIVCSFVATSPYLPGGKQQYVDKLERKKATDCIVSAEFGLSPKQQVSQEVWEKKDLSELLEIVIK
jgi:hypothetical protein